MQNYEYKKNTLLNDRMWYYFNIIKENSDVLNKLDDDQKLKTFNAYRKEFFNLVSAPAVSHKRNNQRKELKEFYEKGEPINWIATAGDISLPQGRQSGNLLLYHLAIEKVNDDKSLIPILYIPDDERYQTIDHHAWLRISNIKYFGDKDQLDISYGDVLFGTSLIKKYENREGKDSYTLGDTIIRKSGVITGDYYNWTCNQNDPRWMSMTNAKVEDYDHDNAEMLHLEYTKKAKQKINQIKKIDINELAKKKYYLTTIYKKWNTFNYHDVFRSKKIASLRNDFKIAAEKEKEFTADKDNDLLSITLYS